MLSVLLILIINIMILIMPDIMSIPTILQSVALIAAIMLAAFVLARSRTPKILKEELDITRSKCERLERDNHNLIKTGHLKDVEIAELKAKTDLQTVMKSQNNMQSQMLANHKQVFEIFNSITTSLRSISETQERIAMRILN